MKKEGIDDEQLRLMREWLSRSMIANERCREAGDAAELRLTEEDCALLRDFGIAIP